jgi:hypothetical protein
MKVHKVTLMIIDTDELGAAGVKEVIENTRYPNHCIGPRVMQVETREIDWNEGDHPINYKDASAAEFVRLFRST